MPFRLIRSEDAGPLTQLYNRLSPESAYQRFLMTERSLDPGLASVRFTRRPDGQSRRPGPTPAPEAGR